MKIKILKNVFLLLIYITVNTAFAQQKKAVMTFDKLKHDFGTIKENGGLATVRFEFKNTGSEPLIITTAQASCGCTEPIFSKQPIPPGGKDAITVSYNPINRPGSFTKTITVTSTAQNSPVELTITGVVAERERTVADDYPFSMKDIRLKNITINFQSLYMGEEQKQELEIINTGKNAATLSFTEVPAHIKISCSPASLKPNEKGKIIVTYNSKLKNDYEFVFDRVGVKVNNEVDPNNKLTVSATIKEKFTDQQKQNPPAIKFNTQTNYDFGLIKPGTKIDYTFTFTNTGKSDLIIRKIKSSCGCVVSNSTPEIIKPGKNGSIKVTFDSKGKTGLQNQLITVITNIPDDKLNKIVLKLTGNVSEVN